MYSVIVVSGSVSNGNAPPVVDAGANVTIKPSEAFIGAGSITDPDDDSWQAVVDYDDGDGEQPLSLAGNSFALSHSYAAVGTYTVRVTVTDSAGGVGTDIVIVTVVDTFPTLPGMNSPVQDIDGDGKTEDINGNGRLDFADLVVLFDHLLSPEVQDNWQYFDFKESGDVDSADVLELFNVLISMGG